MATRGVRFLASDIWDAPENDKRYEVIDGDLYVSPAPDWEHQEQLSNLDYFVKGWVKTHQLGRIVNAPVGVILDDENGLVTISICAPGEVRDVADCTLLVALGEVQ